MYGMSEPQASSLSDCLIEAAIDIFKINSDLIQEDLVDGSADNFDRINRLAHIIERLLSMASMLRHEFDPSLAEEIMSLKQKTTGQIDTLRERAMKIDCTIREGGSIDDPLEELWNVPSAEEAAAEKKKAFETGGGSLLRKPDETPPGAPGSQGGEPKSDSGSEV